MASFLESVWDSIITPGPTPTLLRATNITFFALQTLLLVLLIATYSVHFAVLSCLCAGLWRSINWFAAELKVAEERQRREAQQAAAASRQNEASSSESDQETEVEVSGSSIAERAVRNRKTAGSASREVEVEEVAEGTELKHRGAQLAQEQQREEERTSAARPASVQGTQSSASTEDEWEKVSENENEKDK